MFLIFKFTFTIYFYLVFHLNRLNGDSRAFRIAKLIYLQKQELSKIVHLI